MTFTLKIVMVFKLPNLFIVNIPNILSLEKSTAGKFKLTLVNYLSELKRFLYQLFYKCIYITAFNYLLNNLK